MVHRFLRAIGFGKIKTRKELNSVIKKIVGNAEKKLYTTIDDEDTLYAEYFCDCGKRIGICVRGEYDEEGRINYDYSFPYLKSDLITTYEDISVERQLEKLSYAGVVDDFKIGVSIIFYLQSIITYLKYLNSNRIPFQGTSLTLTGLSDGGMVLMPIAKNPEEIQLSKLYHMRKSRMLRDAVEGDEDAIESLTISDIDTQKILQKKVQEEDVFSLVDTYLMPYGIECDLYAVLGEIKEFQLVTNTYTKEKVYILCLDVNGMDLDICINEKDVTGEIMAGRRFKGVVWLQGEINFPDI